MPTINRALYDKIMVPNYAPMEIVPERGEGARLWDTEGGMYLDFAAGIAVSALGHAHPALREALAEQAGKLWHVSNLMVTRPALELAQKLVDATFAERVFFANSGAEANEAAFKLARRYGIDKYGERKTGIVAFDNAFHGRTFFTVCVGGQPKYSDGFGPRPGDIAHAPFNDVAALEAAVNDDTCAVVMEPIQGEGGVNPATREFARTARALCDRYRALLVFDEIQTGVGRTGYLYAYEWLGVTPDILTTAKGMGGGFPIGAMLTTSEIAASLAVGTHGTTFGGNPMGCAVAGKVLDIVNTPEMLQRVRALSARLLAGLNELNGKTRMFNEIRGKGLLIGCELAEKWQGRARELLQAAQDEGLLTLVAGPDVLRLAPPLIITDDELEAGLQRLGRAMEKLAA
ncbi:MAG: acetylornithine/succinyldiaminopimelate transaminase [Pseudomonadota bacterium]|nr:acetylornithine/succinyldiaminopimelate transaminase [Pseudomonadota bacterium]